MMEPEQPRPFHSITELRGLGAEIWHGIDGQEYVNQLRDEWGRPVGMVDDISSSELENAHAASSHHRDVVMTSTMCGCFYCLRRFAPEEIPAAALVAIDTAPFIYYIERGSAFDALAVELFEDCLATERNHACTSVVTLAEVLVGAIRAARTDIASRYRALLTRGRGLTLLDLTDSTAERAADVRARYNLRLPDAFQVAAAIQAGASHFVTNDDRFRRVTEIAVVVLSDLV